MTDYCSQGRTRPFNVIHLNNCRSHQSYYTCLSRSATHEGTLILHGFNSNMITGGNISGNLRQEFRELELLDDITKLRYENILPDHVNGYIRQDIITKYRHWKGNEHIPEYVHQALHWSKRSPFILNPSENVKWQLIGNKGKNKTEQPLLPIGHKNMSEYVSVKSTNSSTGDDNKTSTPVQHLSHVIVANKHSSKAKNNSCAKDTQATLITYPMQQQHKGMIWDSQNYSCSYDSLFTILWNMWMEDSQKFILSNGYTQNMNFYFLIDGYVKHLSSQVSLEQVRNLVRNHLYRENPAAFPFGQNGVDMKDL